MSFMSILQQRGLDYVVDDIKFQPVVPQNGKKFANLINRIIKENLSVYVDYDCDPDGHFAAKILVETFKMIGFTNYELCRHTIKRHALNEAYVSKVATRKYDVVIILDSSTNDIQAMQELTNSGAICCIVDHHECDYTFSDFPDNTIVINPKLDAKYNAVGYDCLSAGAIMALLCAYTLQVEFKIKPPNDLYLYGAVTLYSDSMSMRNKYNISYISRFQNTQLIDSKLIKLFWDDRYDHFDKSYISFKLVPRLNALFRTETFDLLYKVFFEIDTLDLESVKEQINQHYEDCRKYAMRLVNTCDIKRYPDFIVAILDKLSGAFARNFTGLVANMIAADYNKPVICLHQTTPLEWGGSVRDPFSRDLRSILRSLCYAQGHASAFGIKIDSQSLDMLTSVLAGELPPVSESEQSIIMIDWDKHPDEFKTDLQQMAMFNEFGGNDLPVAMGALSIKNNYRIYRDPRKTMVYGGGEKFLCFAKTVNNGDVMLIKPTLDGSSYKNIVNNIHLS
jgi:hypothetical protein